MRKKYFIIALPLLVLFLLTTASNSQVPVKIKDLAVFDGIRSNHIFGYGLVVGLQGTGDSKSHLAGTTLSNFLKNAGIDAEMTVTKNSAAVLLTAELPPFAVTGEKINVTVSSIGDAKSLEGGTLIQSQLGASDGNIYAVAQGKLSIQGAANNRRGVKTTAVVMQGGVIERNVAARIINENSVSLVLNDWDYTLAERIIKGIEKKYPDSKPQITADGKIQLSLSANIPPQEFLGTLENIEVVPSYKARVVINEKDGTIAAGGSVRLSEAMVSVNGLVVDIEGSSRKGSTAYFGNTTSVRDLVEALNSVGAETSDIISIMKSLKAAGALHAELIIR